MRTTCFRIGLAAADLAAAATPQRLRTTFSSTSTPLFHSFMSTRQKASQSRGGQRGRRRHDDNDTKNKQGGRGRGRRDGGGSRRNNYNNNSSSSSNNDIHRHDRRNVPSLPENACRRNLIQVGASVFVIQKQDQSTGRETAGVVSRILTNSSYHPRGIKVMLASGIVGRMTRITPAAAAAAATTGPLAVSSATRNTADAVASDDDVFMVDDLALAQLVGDMDFELEQAQEALRITNNNIERAIDFLLQLPEES